VIDSILDTGTYGFYIWGSFGLGFAIYAWNWLAPRLQRGEIRKRMSER
jgi:heme exporter protein CcmD